MNKQIRFKIFVGFLVHRFVCLLDKVTKSMLSDFPILFPIQQSIRFLMERKLAALKASVLRNYEEKIDDLLSICESPIERLFLLHLLRHCTSWYSKELEPETTLDSVVFIKDQLMKHVHETKFGLTDLQRIEKYRYRYIGPLWEKVIGFKVKGTGESISAADLIKGIDHTIQRELQVFPQKEVEIDGALFRLDVAILLNRIQDNALFQAKTLNSTVIETRKIAIECDGHAFHSTKEQKERDDRRSRKLQSDGWKVLRYSGSELNGISTESEFKAVFGEIMKVFYAL